MRLEYDLDDDEGQENDWDLWEMLVTFAEVVQTQRQDEEVQSKLMMPICLCECQSLSGCLSVRAMIYFIIQYRLTNSIKNWSLGLA